MFDLDGGAIGLEFSLRKYVVKHAVEIRLLASPEHGFLHTCQSVSFATPPDYSRVA
jgi:hypothetical protein